MSDETDAWARVIARKLAAMERELGVNDALVRQVVDNAQALARDVPLVLPPVPALQQWLAERMDAAIRDLMSADPPEVVVFPATATAHATAPPPTIRTSFTASGTLPAKPKRGLLDRLSPGQILAIVLIWVIASLLPILQLMMPADISSFVANDVATWGFAYAITCAILAKRK